MSIFQQVITWGIMLCFGYLLGGMTWAVIFLLCGLVMSVIVEVFG